MVVLTHQEAVQEGEARALGAEGGGVEGAAGSVVCSYN